MKKLKLALMGVCLAWTAQAAYADDCYSDSLMAYVDSRIPSGNQVERRWEKIKAALLEQDGGMTLARAEEILAARKARGFNLEHMDEVVEAIKCLAAQPEPEPEVVIVPPEPEPEDPPQPLNSDNPSPQQAEITSFRKYFHITPLASTSNEYRINEDDRWEAELILHFDSDGTRDLSTTQLCIRHDYWGGNDYWDNGPITLPGFKNTVDLTAAGQGIVECTDAVSGLSAVTVLQDDHAGTNFVYRTKVRTRDNNVVEDDFSVADDLEFRFGTAFTGKQSYRPETETVVDRDSWWRMDRDEEAFPGTHATYCLGTGSAWERFTPLRCGDQVASKYLDRAPLVGGNCDKSHSDYTVRADVSEAEWMPDRCFSTKVVPKIPPVADNSPYLDNTTLPIIEEDDVSYIKLHKVNGKWTVSPSKPVMVTDGKDCSEEEANQQAELDQLIADARAQAYGMQAADNAENEVRRTFKWSFDSDCDLWWKTDQGLVVKLNSSVANSAGPLDLLIPAVSGIVKDIDYALHELQKVTHVDGASRLTDNPSTDIKMVGPFSEACDYQNQPGGEGVPRKYRGLGARAHGMNSGGGTHMEVNEPPVDSNLCN